MLLLPQKLLNPYPATLAAQFMYDFQPLHAAHEAGDWLVSLSGCARMREQNSTLAEATDCERLVHEYAELGLQQFF